jgi:hypothetical protein
VIVRLYVKEENGFNKIAEVLGRSSLTPLTQIWKHNSLQNGAGSAQHACNSESNIKEVASKE